MNKDIEIAIDLAAVTMLTEMYPNEIDMSKVMSVAKVIANSCTEQPSAEMLLEALHQKYCAN